MAEKDMSQFRYAELEKLRMVEESEQLDDNEPEYDFLIMGVAFCDMLRESYPALSGEILVRCVQRYINHCIRKNKLNITRTQQRKVFTAEECLEHKPKFLAYESGLVAHLESEGKFVHL